MSTAPPPDPSTTQAPATRGAGIGGAAEGFDSALTARVRLYLRVCLFNNLVLTSMGLVLMSQDATIGRSLSHGLKVGVALTSLTAMAWFLMRRARLTTVAAHAVASVITLVLAATYTHVSTANLADPNPTRTVFFALITVTLLLVLRSSLIPSRATTTLFVGLLAVASPIAAAQRVAVGQDWVLLPWITVVSLLIVLVTAVTSHTVYGLQQRMRAVAQLGQYQLEHLLGRGGMGEVYFAKHALLQRPTAVKLLRDVSTHDRFRREVLAASGLTHPNTVEIYDYGRSPEGVFYFAMEYVEGATLAEVVRATGPMPSERVLHLLAQAASALGEAHGRGLVHRDVKPSNLMLCERGGTFDTLKVMDFGLVRDLEETGVDGARRGLAGTPLYLAPEAILDPDGAVPASDVYALAATAYVLLTGDPPFPSERLVDVLGDHLATDPPALEDVPADLGALLLRCLAKDPLTRPADARALLADLRACEGMGRWSERDAAVWWAEHREVVTAHQLAGRTEVTERSRAERAGRRSSLTS